MIKYDKLVRDRIPEIIKNAGKEYQIHIADKDTTLKYLIKKFDEELNEFSAAYDKEELADILELVHGLAYQLGYDMDEINQIREQKAIDRGGFKERIILEYVKD